MERGYDDILSSSYDDTTSEEKHVTDDELTRKLEEMRQVIQGIESRSEKEVEPAIQFEPEFKGEPQQKPELEKPVQVTLKPEPVLEEKPQPQVEPESKAEEKPLPQEKPEPKAEEKSLPQVESEPKAEEKPVPQVESKIEEKKKISADQQASQILKEAHEQARKIKEAAAKAAEIELESKKIHSSDDQETAKKSLLELTIRRQHIMGELKDISKTLNELIEREENHQEKIEPKAPQSNRLQSPVQSELSKKKDRKLPILEKIKTPQERKDVLFTTLKIAAIVVVLLFIVFRVFLGVTVVKDNSMNPMASKGNIILYNRLDKKLKQNEVAVLRSNTGEFTARRIVGVTGETIEMSQDATQILVNESSVIESFNYENHTKVAAMEFPVTVPEASYFVIADNATASTEGIIKKTSVEGTLLFVL